MRDRSRGSRSGHGSRTNPSRWPLETSNPSLLQTVLTKYSQNNCTGASKRSHILFTSGSTGRPKAVQIMERAILNLAVETSVTPLQGNDRVAEFNNPGSDSVSSRFGCHCCPGLESSSSQDRLSPTLPMFRHSWRKTRSPWRFCRRPCSIY